MPQRLQERFATRRAADGTAPGPARFLLQSVTVRRSRAGGAARHRRPQQGRIDTGTWPEEGAPVAESDDAPAEDALMPAGLDATPDPAATLARAAHVDTGLTSAQVRQRVERALTNHVSDRSSRSLWSIVRENVFTLFNGIVVGAFLLLLLLGQWRDALFGFTAIANAFIGVGQEFRAKRTLDRLAVLDAPHARVLRDGAEGYVAMRAVVLGDILVLRAGDQIAADAEVVWSKGLEVDESMLTGESESVRKNIGDHVLSGSTVTAGEARVHVIRVGDDSFAGRITLQARRFSLVHSELRAAINRVLRWISIAIGPTMIIILNGQMQHMGGWRHALATGEWRFAAVGTVAAVIAMIPLGLVLLTSITFAVGAAKLAGQKVLVQELPAVEGLARVDVICLDKTGTLTEGDIEFEAVHEVDVDAHPGWADVLGWFGTRPDANATARCLASDFPSPGSDGMPAVEAVQSVAFSPARKWSAVTFETIAPGTWVLGAPELVLAGDEPAAARASALAATGRRTLVLARSTERTGGDEDHVALPGDLRPVVLVTLSERLRPDAARTLDYFREQGVTVRVISGDSPDTVAAVAREVGIDADTGFDGRDLPSDPAELERIVEEHTVFGRVTPDQKRDLVLALQRSGHVVAMTGDGVNDALAVKAADMGIAMGSATPATKAVSRIVLLDGQFARLPGVVAEGRRVMANMERVSMLFLTKTAYAFATALVFGVLFWGFPFLPRQLSATDGLTIGIPAFFLALMPNALRYQAGFLGRALRFVIPAGLIVTAMLVVINAYARSRGVQSEDIRSASTLVLALIGLWILLELARPLNWVRIVIVAGMVAGLVLLYAVPFVAHFFRLRFPDDRMLTVSLVTAAAGCIAIEVVRIVWVRALRRATE
jgi:ATPase, P-type (transporting), HAD superfamily, subfamily IC